MQRREMEPAAPSKERSASTVSIFRESTFCSSERCTRISRSDSSRPSKTAERSGSRRRSCASTICSIRLGPMSSSENSSSTTWSPRSGNCGSQATAGSTRVTTSCRSAPPRPLAWATISWASRCRDIPTTATRVTALLFSRTRTVSQTWTEAVTPTMAPSRSARRSTREVLVWSAWAPTRILASDRRPSKRAAANRYPALDF